jgi:uncharacterized protein YjbI with pentapeptide repeats
VEEVDMRSRRVTGVSAALVGALLSGFAGWPSRVSAFDAVTLNQLRTTKMVVVSADLTNADLHGADLQSANLYLANLGGANLSGAILSNANLEGAFLEDANVSGADLTGTTMPNSRQHP